jgi:hypothetical protein
MKFILLLLSLLLCGGLHLGRAVKTPNAEELASKVYEMANEKFASFFKTKGTPVTDYVHPSLRTEEAEIHPRATAHITYYKDSDCTQIDYILDRKISRCLSSFGNQRIRIVSEQDSSWILAFEQYDDACENALGGFTSEASFPKNVCIDGGDGISTSFDIIAHPLKSIPAGGAAFVFYDSQNDCDISKHTNLARAHVMWTWPMGVCQNGFLGYQKVVSCDSTAWKLDIYNDNTCTPEPISQGSFSTVPAVSCPDIEFFSIPYQVLCIADSETASG